MSPPASVVQPESERIDQQIVIGNVPWGVYEALDAARGEGALPRMSYLDGTLELTTLSYEHAAISIMIHDLIRAWADELDVPLNAAGSWTQKHKSRRAALEPDQCYSLGERRPRRPDIAVEVVWTSGTVDKLEIYQRFRIPEVWFWRDDRIHVYALTAGRYEPVRHSALLPELDLKLLARYVRRDDQTQAIREYRSALRRQRRH